MINLKSIFKRKRRRRKNGHWLIYLVLASLALGLWYIPAETVAHEVGEIETKVGLISGMIRRLAGDLTLTAKAMGTLVAGIIGLAVLLWSRRKSA